MKALIVKLVMYFDKLRVKVELQLYNLMVYRLKCSKKIAPIIMTLVMLLECVLKVVLRPAVKMLNYIGKLLNIE